MHQDIIGRLCIRLTANKVSLIQFVTEIYKQLTVTKEQ